MWLCMWHCTCVWLCMWHGTCVEVWGQLVACPLSAIWVLGSNLGHQPCNKYAFTYCVPSLAQIVFWGRVSCWPRAHPLGWLATECQGSVCFCPMALGLQIRNTILPPPQTSVLGLELRSSYLCIQHFTDSHHPGPTVLMYSFLSLHRQHKYFLSPSRKSGDTLLCVFGQLCDGPLVLGDSSPSGWNLGFSE